MANVHPYVRLAREAVDRHLMGRADIPTGADIDPNAELWNIRRACFVSIKRASSGKLRGCIGTILPVKESVDREIVMNAISAATNDRRFPPMIPGEADQVKFSVDVLSAPELIEDRSMLDPRTYGIIVTKGIRHGVLLPALAGVSTVNEQIRIAMQKAGIKEDKDVEIERFTVDRYEE